ncbi:MAG: two-component sensor histidine kinase [Shinella sp.]|jgi:signal transduction histidine kinase|nr:MAG: two-component sensor histidine kinase [Shinella sp.]
MRMPALLRTSSFRLTLLYAGLFTTSVALLLGIVYLEVGSYSRHLQDEIVKREVQYLRQAQREGGDAAVQALIEQRLRQPLIKSMRYVMQDADGHRISGNAPAQHAPSEGWFWFRMPKGDDPRQSRKVRAYGLPMSSGGYLIVGEAGKATEEFDGLQAALLRDLGYALLAVLALALIGGTLMSQLMLRRVERIVRDTRAIILGRPARRLPVGGSGDEFDRLSASVNQMLDRIDSQADALRQVSNDIAHDLRTPLTRLHQQLERGRRLHDPRALQRVLERATEEVDTTLRTFSSLLHIAQIDGDPQQLQRQPVNLSELLDTLAEVHLPAFEAAQQPFHAAIAPALQVNGNRDLLGQLFSNLLENASRHCPAGTRLALHAQARGDSIVVSVDDNGPGIPVSEQENVLRRLYRLERSRSTPGSGLGLAMVEAVARAHGAELELRDNLPGLRVQVRLPRLQADAAPNGRDA